eukprot:gene9867-2189_t
MPPAKKKPTLDEIQNLYHLPLNEAAVQLGICKTLLKQCCRKYSINRWPYRKFKAESRRFNEGKEVQLEKKRYIPTFYKEQAQLNFVIAHEQKNCNILNLEHASSCRIKEGSPVSADFRTFESDTNESKNHAQSRCNLLPSFQELIQNIEKNKF